MHKNRQLTLIFSHFEQEHLGKDVFLVPYYLGKHLNMSVEIVYPQTKTNKHFESSYKGVALHPIWCPKSRYFWILSAWYLLWNAYKIDILMQFHFSKETLVSGLCYKYLNKKGKLYIKCDGIYWLDVILEKQIPGTFRYKAFHRLLKQVDKVSIELIEGYSRLLNNKYCGVSLRDKSVLMPNGFDEDYFSSLEMKEYVFSEKENIILTVGRIGDENKNTNFLLKALEDVDMGNWKVYFVGQILSTFKSRIENFFLSYPAKRDSVFFLGPIYDKRELWSYYNRSKVFVLTSKSESYGLVLNEAKRFRNFIVSTNVGAFKDLVSDENCGCNIEQDDVDDLAHTLQMIIDGELSVDAYGSDDMSFLSWSKMIEKLSFH